MLPISRKKLFNCLFVKKLLHNGCILNVFSLNLLNWRRRFWLLILLLRFSFYVASSQSRYHTIIIAILRLSGLMNNSGMCWFRCLSGLCQVNWIHKLVIAHCLRFMYFCKLVLLKLRLKVIGLILIFENTAYLFLTFVNLCLNDLGPLKIFIFEGFVDLCSVDSQFFSHIVD